MARGRIAGQTRTGGGAPRDHSTFEWVASGGVHYQGLLPGRDEDTLAVGVVFAQVSRDARWQQRDDRDVNGVNYVVLADHEFVLEVTYRCHLRPWLVVEPDVQWMRHPGGSGATPDAFLLGLRANLTF
ncbi:MAG TPA: carbohydrate porin [Opitutaceae bacterium]